MIEDKLTREERIRLECLAQAVSSAIGKLETEDVILRKAKRFETYIKDGS